MNYPSFSLFVVTLIYSLLSEVICDKCNIVCNKNDSTDEMLCGFIPKDSKYKMFPSKCEMMAFVECNNVALVATNLKFCIKDQISKSRRSSYSFEDSCPVFCPSHYRPVCAASEIRFYKYRSFNNGCYLDMLNCRGDEDDRYVEVPLHFCQNHQMKNIFKTKIISSNMDEHNPYF